MPAHLFHDSLAQVSQERLLNLPAFDSDGRMPVSKLSAREPALRSLMIQRKVDHGFVSKIVSPIRIARAATPAPGHSSSSKGDRGRPRLKTPGYSKEKQTSVRELAVSRMAPASPSLVVHSLEAVPELKHTRPKVEEPLIFIC